MVDHGKVAGYLSASDIGFCLVQQSPSRKFCSPIKVGEYLANGLPVVISKDIGEDSDRIHAHDLGLVIDMEQYGSEEAKKILELRRKKVDPTHIQYRNVAHAFRIYQSIIRQFTPDEPLDA